MPNTQSKPRQKEIVIVGGGPVGCAAALYLARRGYKVSVYEMRPNPCLQGGKATGKSINLTLSERGLLALSKIEMRQMILDQAIRCIGRRIHDRDNKKRISLYGDNNESIFSVDRELLYMKLIEAVDRCPNTSIWFDHKLVSINFEGSSAIFQAPDSSRSADDTEGFFRTITVNADVILGCDGANSCVRKYMNRESNLGYREESIDDRYLELRMPPTSDGKFAMEKNYLHVWARDDFLLLALPNNDCSFTVTLFMPTRVFESIQDRETAKKFVYKNFPDAVPLIGEEQIVNSLSSRGNAHSLMWVKCTRFNIGGKIMLLGDAAHAMVPFYGQGINCGFEDLKVFDELLDRHNDDFETAMNEFSEIRTVDTDAMCDLSLQNYNVLKKKVNTRWLSCRKWLDSCLHKMLPNTWVPLYTMVAFSNMRYSECVRNKKWQDRVIRGVLAGLVATAVVGSALVYKLTVS